MVKSGKLMSGLFQVRLGYDLMVKSGKLMSDLFQDNFIRSKMLNKILIKKVTMCLLRMCQLS